jgi:hypothetical protein
VHLNSLKSQQVVLPPQHNPLKSQPAPLENVPIVDRLDISKPTRSMNHVSFIMHLSRLEAKFRPKAEEE